ncbi:MAG TPA: hypothetical protein PKN04_07970 [bacterium]|jgi:hypothetical protein|nr:hypothetical protein [bacterium]HNT65695.1 hypothetical protein [bacterium]HOX84854.1 hypothetical protein [bacterium]HPG44280.1 hypothetical protein [bacterium]HPM96647.1 hypothetical protein [bacterium]
MNRGVRLYLSFFGLMVLCLLMSCSTAHMALPTELLDSSEMLVCNGRGGFDETFTMGSYQVQNVKRGWTKKNEWGFIGYSSSNTKQQFEFSLISPTGERWQGQAATNLKQKELEGQAWGGQLEIALSEQENFVVRCSGPSTWTLVLVLNSKKNLHDGIYTNTEQNYVIRGTHKLSGSPMPLTDATGYVISFNGEVLAAVEVINDGAVWFSKKLSNAERDQLAAAAAALLLYRDLDA